MATVRTPAHMITWGEGGEKPMSTLTDRRLVPTTMEWLVLSTAFWKYGAAAAGLRHSRAPVRNAGSSFGFLCARKWASQNFRGGFQRLAENTISQTLRQLFNLR